MLKNIVHLSIAAAAIASTMQAAEARPIIRDGVNISPRSVPVIPRGPQIDPRMQGAFNIRNVSLTFNTEGTVEINGYRCPRTFLLFPVITSIRPVDGQVSINTGVGFTGRDRFSASEFRRDRRGYTMSSSTIRFTPDWRRLGPGYQFSFKIRVDSPAGTNWRLVRQGFYPGKHYECTAVDR